MRTLTIALLAFAASMSGCSSYDIEAKFEVDDGRVAILPVRDPEFRGTFSSPRGRQIAIRASEVLAREYGESAIVHPSKYLESFIEMDRRWLKASMYGAADVEDPSEMSVQAVADKIGTEFILIAEIQPGGWRIKQPGAVNFLQGSAMLKAKFYDNRGKEVKLIGTERIRIRYPVKFDEQEGLSTMSVSEDQIENGLVRVSGRYLAELFYDHDEDAVLKIRMR